MPAMNQARKASDYTVDEMKLKLQMSLNNYTDGLACTGNSSVVSTGLKLSYEDNERNSCITSGSGSMSLPTTTPFVNDIMTEMEKGNKEIDHYFKIQVYILSYFIFQPILRCSFCSGSNDCQDLLFVYSLVHHVNTEQGSLVWNGQVVFLKLLVPSLLVTS
jgi:hypothetical protein